MKMDFHLIAVDKNQYDDHAYGEVAKQCSVPKYFKDKRKAVVASKQWLLNAFVCCTPQSDPFLHHTKSKKQDLGEESMKVANGFLDLVAMCEEIKKETLRGKKRKCMDDCIGSTH
ncbi:unnamed protein product [Mucor fragilis]